MKQIRNETAYLVQNIIEEDIEKSKRDHFYSTSEDL